MSAPTEGASTSSAPAQPQAKAQGKSKPDATSIPGGGGASQAKMDKDAKNKAKNERRAAKLAARSGDPETGEGSSGVGAGAGAGVSQAQAGTLRVAPGPSSGGGGTSTGGLNATTTTTTRPALTSTSSQSPAQAPAPAPTTQADAVLHSPEQIINSRASSHPFFAHLPNPSSPSSAQALISTKIHPLIIRLGVLMSSGTLRGANARTMAMMTAFAEVIREYVSPDNAELAKDLIGYLSPMIAWLESCRPKGVGGGNAIRWLKSEITRLGEQNDRSEAEQKAYLVKAIEMYLRDRIDLAGQVISAQAKEKIKPGDTVVTYARSSVVERVLIEAFRDMQATDPRAEFNVIVVDARPLEEGKALLKSLRAAGIPCTYVYLTLLASSIPRADLVLLGASALHSDGALFARAGTAVVAMLAKEYRVPVVACVETYKFGEKVLLDGLATNELGDGKGLFEFPINRHLEISTKHQENELLTPVVLLYDLTPPHYITAVCTEIGFIPPSSVPTVLGKAAGIA